MDETRIAWGLGLLGGILFLVGAAVAFLAGSVDLAFGRFGGAANAGASMLLLAVMGGLAIFFAHLGRTAWSGRTFSAGLLLLVVALLAAIVVGPAAFGLGLVGAVLVALAGVLYLIEPMRHAARWAATA